MIKKLCESHDTLFSSADISIFSSEISKISYIKKYRYRLYLDTKTPNLLTFFESLKIAFIKIVVNLMIPAKIATLGLLKIKILGNTGNDIIIFVYDIANKILSRNLNYIVDMVI